MKSIIRRISLWSALVCGIACLGIAYSALKNPTPVTRASQAAAKESLAGSYLAGYYAIRHYDTPQASSFFLDALKQDPTNVALLNMAYHTFVLSGNIPKALQMAREYTLGRPASVTGNIMLAMEAIRYRNFVKAERILSQKNAENSAIDTMVVPFLMSWCKVGQGKYEEALDMLDAIESTYMEYTAFVDYQRALIHDLAGHTQEADKYYTRLMARQAKPYRFVRAATNFYERTGKITEARALYSAYQDQDPISATFQEDVKRLDQKNYRTKPLVKNVAQGIGELLLEIASGLYKGQLYRDAQIYIQMILYLDPGASQARSLLASYYEQIGLYEESIAEYQKVKPESDFYWQARISAAQNLYRIGKIAEAKRLLRSIIREKPEHHESLLVLAELLTNESDYKEAAELYDRVIVSLKEELPAHWVLHYLRGISYERAGEWEKAETDLLKALELSPNQPDVLNYLGYSWLAQGKYVDRAAAMIRAALEQRPDNPQILDSMGWALFLQANYPAAARYLEKATELLPTDVTINEHLGDVYWRLGRYVEARFQWQHALTFAKETSASELLQYKLENGLTARDNDMHHMVYTTTETE